MRSILRILFLSTLLFTFSGANIHKFYVGIYQVDYAKEKKMLQITSRIFIDDLNDALEHKYNKKFTIGEASETPEQTALMQKYLTENFTIRINGKTKPLNYLSKELENTVLICYFNIKEVPKISDLQISNKILFDFVTEQQNIIQTNVNGQKKSLLLSAENSSGEIKY